jgi:hypothetical protein
MRPLVLSINAQQGSAVSNIETAMWITAARTSGPLGGRCSS